MKSKLDSLENSLIAISGLMDFSQSIASAAPTLLELLGAALGCDWGTFWEVDAKVHVLRPAATWSKPGIEAKKLELDTRDRALSLSEGTAGHVWRSRKPIWSVDLITDMCLPRSLDATGVGLHGGAWFPLKTESAVYGVIELLGSSLPVASEELLVGIEALGTHIGYQIEKHLSPPSTGVP